MEQRESVIIKDFLGLNTRDSELDIPPNAARDLLNVEFGARGWRVRTGILKVNTTSGSVGSTNITGIYDGFNNIIVTYGTKASTLSGSTITERITTLTDSRIPVFASYNALDLMVNGIDAPQSWDGTTWAALGGSPPVASDIVVWRNHVFLTGLTSPNQGEVRFSELETATVWPSGHFLRPTKREKGGDLICSRVVPFPGEEDGTRLAVFSSDKIYHFDGFNKSLFQIYTVKTGLGSAAARSHVNAENYHFWMDEAGFYCTPDGGYTVNQISWNIQPTFDAIGKSFVPYTVGGHNRYKRQIWWAVSLNGVTGGGSYLNRVLVYNYGLSTPMTPGSDPGARHVWSMYDLRFLSMAEIFVQATGTYTLYGGEANAASKGGWVYDATVGDNLDGDVDSVSYVYETPPVVPGTGRSSQSVLRKTNFVYDGNVDSGQTLTHDLYMEGQDLDYGQSATQSQTTTLASVGSGTFQDSEAWWNRQGNAFAVRFSGACDSTGGANFPRCHRIEFEFNRLRGTK